MLKAATASALLFGAANASQNVVTKTVPVPTYSQIPTKTDPGCKQWKNDKCV